jgi:hypothetical protein
VEVDVGREEGRRVSETLLHVPFRPDEMRVNDNRVGTAADMPKAWLVVFKSCLKGSRVDAPISSMSALPATASRIPHDTATLSYQATVLVLATCYLWQTHRDD